ncbi:MAG TPA: phosphoribosyltransferase family protein [Pirellulales bacterium]|nr:phosphoribosyltransferase family protein [Pirellulales bacterium]
MTESEILAALGKVSALITSDHIVYTSGRHGESYVNKDAVYPHTELTSQLCEQIARHFAPAEPEIVAAPALGGIVLSQWTAHHLCRLLGKEVLSVYAEKVTDEAGFVIKRGYDQLLRGKRVLVVEDVLTTGGSVKKVIELVATLGGHPIGAGVLCNRGNLQPEDIGARELYALVKVDLASWEERECPLCARGVPVNLQVGKGREFTARRSA